MFSPLSSCIICILLRVNFIIVKLNVNVYINQMGVWRKFILVWVEGGDSILGQS